MTRRIDDYNEAYNNFIWLWSAWQQQAENDIRFKLGDQWSASEKAYLKKKKRNAFVFNKIRRVVKILTGYQRKNRLAYKVDPVGDSDTETASQFSQLLQDVMRICNGYNVMSDAFERGAVTTGLNLVDPWMDYSTDPLNGDIRLKRVPHNRFLLDPSFTERDLSDCNQILRREWISRDAAKAIVPDFAKEIDRMPISRGHDNKFWSSHYNINLYYGNMMRYDEHWKRVYKPVNIIIDPFSGRSFKFEGSERDVRELLRQVPDLVRTKRYEKDVEVTIFIEDEEVYHGPEPNGLNDYRFVPVMGFFESEYVDMAWKLQGLVRCMIDPQREANKRRSKNLDILDSQLNSGWMAEENAVLNPEALYQTGQGQAIWLKENPAKTIEQRLTRIHAPDIPPGQMDMLKLMDADLLDTAGVNQEILGLSDMNEVEVAAVLAKVRTGQALTVLQDLFDNYGMAKSLLGRRIIKMIQKNWEPEKVQRMTERPVTRSFYDKDTSQYDVTVTEGVLTDSQKQMQHTQLMAYKKIGMNIPDAAIIEASNLERKDLLIKAIQGEAQSANQAMQIQNALQAASIESIKAKAVRDMVSAEEKKTQSVLNKILGIKEMANIRIEGIERGTKVLKDITETESMEREALLPPVPDKKKLVSAR